jgi:hypothetical protein
LSLRLIDTNCHLIFHFQAIFSRLIMPQIASGRRGNRRIIALDIYLDKGRQWVKKFRISK